MENMEQVAVTIMFCAFASIIVDAENQMQEFSVTYISLPPPGPGTIGTKHNGDVHVQPANHNGQGQVTKEPTQGEKNDKMKRTQRNIFLFPFHGTSCVTL